MNNCFLIILALAVGNSWTFEWNTSILEVPPWPMEKCNTPPRSNDCLYDEPKECKFNCRNLNECLIHVAIILPYDTYYILNLNKATDAVYAALNQSYELSILDERIKVKVQGFDDKCKQDFATIRVMNASSVFCANVILGPACDYCLASVARVAKYLGNYGTPVIAPLGLSFDFTNPKSSCDDEFYMLVNSGQADYRSYGEFFHLIMDRYKWNKIALMYNKDQQNELGGEHSCHLMFKSVMQEIKNVPNLQYDDGDLLLLGLNQSQYLKQNIGTRYAIILLCTNQKAVRELAIEAYNLNMMQSGEYTIFNFDVYNNVSEANKPWYDATDPERNEIAQKAYRQIYTFMPAREADFEKVNRTTPRGSLYLDDIHDGMLLYVNALNKTIEQEKNSTEMDLTGDKILRNMMGHQFKGKSDGIQMNCNAQRTAKYVMVNLNSTGQYEVVAEYSNLNKNITKWNVNWLNGDPKDTPICGFDNSLCPSYNTVDVLLISIIVLMVVSFFIVGLISYRHFKLRAAIYSLAWKVNHDDIVFVPIKPRSSFQSMSSFYRNGIDDDGLSVAGERQLYTNVGLYKLVRVAVKYLREVKIELGHSELIELKSMKDLSHDNLVKFHGACVDIPNCILTEYCPKGSLQDILENEKMKLDSTFRMSLIMDIVRGMTYLHNSAIGSHGALKSTNCLVDSRFVLKISDFGIHFIRKYGEEHNHSTESHAYWERQLWTAPEILRMHNAPAKGTQKGDVYSFSMIMHEIIQRQGVFYLEEFQTARGKVELVRKGLEENGGQLLRPSLNESLYTKEVAAIMKKCWAEDSSDRPDFSTLKTKLRQINKESDGNLMDNLLARMEHYANNLESLVEERTADYLEEKRRCEVLLYQLLPKSVAQQLISGESVIAETFEYVTIHFSDIVGFTALSAESTPLQVVDFLNDLYTCFDSIIENFDVYKVETIGDSYMVVSGLPERNDNRHAREIARMSIALLDAVRAFKIPHRRQEKLMLRVGIHTGPCVAGVVGLKMPRYCLFGDTVNTASRMETNGEALRIHISPVTKEFLDTFGSFIIESRGEVELKGKGKMNTFWLIGEHVAQENEEAKSIKPNKYPNTPIPTNAKRQTTAAAIKNESEHDNDDIDEYQINNNNNNNNNTNKTESIPLLQMGAGPKNSNVIT